MATVTGLAAVQRRLTRYRVRFRATVRNVLVQQAAVIERRLKAEHPWQNQTGKAEAGLHCGVLETDTGFTVRAKHGDDVPYGVFLEHANQGRFAVLEPTMRSQWPKTRATVGAAIRRVEEGTGMR